MIQKQRLITLAQQLIRIDSQNPPGDEYAIACFIKAALKRFGLASKIVTFKKRRANIVAVIPGKNTAHSLLITPHLDTVPAGKRWKYPPLAAHIRGGRLYGLGSTDCKCNLACSIEVLNSLLEEKVTLPFTLMFAATADEESGSLLGLEPLLDKGVIRPTQALVLDADDFSIIVAQKGLLHLKVKLQGKRAHGAYPWLGENAIDAAMNIMLDLKKHPLAFKSHRYLKPPTINCGTIQGGDKVNVVADWCEFELDFRFLPGERAQTIIQNLKRTIQRHCASFSIEIEGTQKPFSIAVDHPLVSTLTSAFRSVGAKPRIKGSEGATTISFFQERHIPAVATGFGCEGCAHMADEYVTIDNLYKGARALESFLHQYRIFA
ncbi:MAG: M20 family metallopeptidase [Candidatus Omnitrophica bacterium]|nr:M20 family metallopeptidase [Candidatus Omnitrophota bacterium]